MPVTRNRRNAGGTTALLIVDMIKPLDFRGGAAMLPRALAAAGRIASLKQRLKAAGHPVIYANDNFTKWRMDFGEIGASTRCRCRVTAWRQPATPGPLAHWN